MGESKRPILVIFARCLKICEKFLKRMLSIGLHGVLQRDRKTMCQSLIANAMSRSASTDIAQTAFCISHPATPAQPGIDMKKEEDPVRRPSSISVYSAFSSSFSRICTALVAAPLRI